METCTNMEILETVSYREVRIMNLLFSSSYFGFGAMFFGLGWLVLSMVQHIPFGVVTGLGAIITAIGTGVTVHALSKLEKIEVSEN